MNYKRIFTFGCSFTNWIWPTWADIIAVQTNIPVYNGALSGLGNVGIAHRLVEYDLRYNFTESDLILIMWTGWNREDRYLKDGWQLCGNIFNNHFYDDKFIKKYWSLENDIIKNSSAILLANKSYKVSDNYSAFGYAVTEGIGPSYKIELADFYIKALPTPIIFEFGKNYNFNKRCLDGHPDILTHAKFYNEHIAKKYNFPEVVQGDCFHQWQQHLEETLPQTTYHEQQEYIKEYFRTKNHSFSKT